MTEKAQTVQEMIRALPEYGENPAIIAFRQEETGEYSYEELYRKISGLAAGLAYRLSADNRPVAVWATNSPQWIIAALAVIRAGGILLPVDQQADKETLEHIFRDSGADIVLTGEDMAAKINKLELPRIPETFYLDRAEGQQSWTALAAGELAELKKSGPDDTAVLFYTSGTTGPPKGVPLSHANLISQPDAIRETGLITSNDRVLLPLPLHHVYPFVLGMLTPLAMGLPIILPEALTGRAIIKAVNRGRATIIIGVPRLYRTLFEGVRSRIAGRGRIAGLFFDNLLGLSRLLRDNFGLLAGRRLFAFIHRQFGSSLRVLASGGSALDPQLAARLEGLGWQVAVGYGLTETSPLITINPPGSGRLRSAGKAVKGVHISIASDRDTRNDGDEYHKAGNKEGGEVLVRGPNVFGGYLNLPEKSRESFTGAGWFRTGDLGIIDDEGYLYLRGRAKTLIITESGKNLQPDEIEVFYARHPAIREIGVFLNERRLTGIIVPEMKQAGAEGTDMEEIIRKAVSQQSADLPTYKALDDYVVTRQSLPRTRLGKIRRHLLEERYKQAKTAEDEDGGGGKGAIALSEMSDHDQALLEDKNSRTIWDWLAGKYPQHRLTPDSSPRFDLGIDSIEWLDISLEVQQRTGVELTEEVIGEIETIRDLLEQVSRQSRTESGVDPEKPLRDPESVLDDDQKRWLAPQGPFMSAMRLVVYHSNRLLMKTLFRLTVHGRENLPQDRHYLITPNHLSFLDPLAITAALSYKTLGRTFFAGWTGIAFRNAFFRFFSRLARAVPIDYQSAISSSLAYGSAVLGRNNNLIWFPEGGRSPDGTLKEFKPGISLLLEHHDVPVVPVFIKGTYETLPRGAFFPRFHRISVTFGTPATRDQLQEGRNEEAARDRIRNGLHDKVEALRKTLETDAYDHG